MSIDARLPLGIKAGFTGGQIAGQVLRDVPSLLLLFYLTSVVGVEPAIAGTTIFVPKLIFGVLSDLGIGIASDRIVDRFPRRRWLLIAAALAPLALIMLFRVPAASTVAQAAYVFVVMSLYMLGFSAASVPYLAQYSEITDNPRERTVLMAWRHGFTGAGIVIGSAMAPALIHRFGGDRASYGIASCVLAAICASSLLIAYASASRIPVRAVRNAPRVDLRALAGVFAYRPFRILLALFFLQEVGAGMTGASIAFFLTYCMKMPNALGNLGIIALLAGFVVILASPVWIAVSRRIGKTRSYMAGAIAHGLLLLAWGSSTEHTPVTIIFAISAAIGLANSGWGIMVLALLGDMIADSTAETGEDRGGSFSAVWTLTEKIGLALGATLVAGNMLSAFGFSSAAAVHGGVQPDSALLGIALTFGFVPAAINVAAALLYWRFGRPERSRAASRESPSHGPA